MLVDAAVDKALPCVRQWAHILQGQSASSPKGQDHDRVSPPHEESRPKRREADTPVKRDDTQSGETTASTPKQGTPGKVNTRTMPLSRAEPFHPQGGPVPKADPGS